MMTRDEWIYCILLLLSFLFGFIFKGINGPNAKKATGSLLGFSMVVVVCGWHTLHSVIVTMVTILIIRLMKRQCHIYSFIWCFSYLLFFRTTQYLGLPKVSPVSNAVQLLLTLKLVGLAFEVSDSIILEEQIKKDTQNHELQLRMKFEAVDPSILDMISYAYCYIGLLTGPYFRFRTYYDMLKLDSRNIPIMPHLLVRIRSVLMCIVVFLVTSRFFWIGYVLTEEFLQSSILYRLWFMIPMFIWFRARMYAAWIMAECVCITSCLGAYPPTSKPRCGKGPTDLEPLEKDTENKTEYDFETIHNINIHGCELEPSIRKGMRAWNMTVQYWLATYIFKRVPIRPLRTVITMTVSAYWHGLHPGYYLSFMTIPLALIGEDICAKEIKERLPEKGKKVYNILHWFFRFREFDYMCMGFLLLTFEGTIRYWSSIYYIIHVSMLVVIAIGLIVRNLMPPVKQKET